MYEFYPFCSCILRHTTLVLAFQPFATYNLASHTRWGCETIIVQLETCWKEVQKSFALCSQPSRKFQHVTCMCMCFGGLCRPIGDTGEGKNDPVETRPVATALSFPMHCETQIWAECIDELEDVTTIRSGRKSEVHKLYTCTEMHKELYACTGQCEGMVLVNF